MTFSAERKLEIAREAAADAVKRDPEFSRNEIAKLRAGNYDHWHTVVAARRALDLAEADRPVGETGDFVLVPRSEEKE